MYQFFEDKRVSPPRGVIYRYITLNDIQIFKYYIIQNNHCQLNFKLVYTSLGETGIT